MLRAEPRLNASIRLAHGHGAPHNPLPLRDPPRTPTEGIAIAIGATASAPRKVELGIWQLAWPTAAAFGLQALVGLVDFLFIGTLGAEAVAAAGVATQLYFIQFALFASVTTGTTAMIARTSGAGDLAESDRALRTSLAVGLVVGGLCMALIPFADALVAAFGLEPRVAALGGSYLRIAFAFSLPLGLGTVFAAALQAAGDVKTPLFVGAVINVVNVVGDYALVLGHFGAPALGVRGAAIASGLGTAVGLALVSWLWLSGRLRLRRTAWLSGVDLAIARRILRVGLPSAAETTLFNLGILVFTSFMARFGTAAVGAYFIGVRILFFSFIPGIAFQVAASTLVGQNLGAGTPADAARAGWRSCGFAASVMALLGLLIAWNAEGLTGWFATAGADTVQLAERFIWILAAAQPLIAVEFTLGGALRGAGDTRFPLFAVMAGLGLGRLSTALFVIHVLHGDVVAVWYCLLADYGIKALLLSTRFASGSWKSVTV